MSFLTSLSMSIVLFSANLAHAQPRVVDIPVTIPDTYGAKTDFGNIAMKSLSSSTFGDIHLESGPHFEHTTIAEPTCSDRFGYCSTTYFGEDLTSVSLDKATFKVEWHNDITPATCRSSNGCELTSEKAVAKSDTETEGWNMAVTIDSKLNFDTGKTKGDGGTGITIGYSETKTHSSTVTSTKSFKGTCGSGEECFVETGTVYVEIEGTCTSDPLMVCNGDIHPCNDMATYSNACSQYSTFTNDHCTPNGKSKNPDKPCTIRVGVTQIGGTPFASQVFEKLPSSSRTKRDNSEDTFGTLPDGSTGAWIPFTVDH